MKYINYTLVDGFKGYCYFTVAFFMGRHYFPEIEIFSY